MSKNEAYSSDSMKTKKGLQAIRDLPGMYIGSTTSSDGESPRALSQIIQEVISNATDEIRAGYGSFVKVTLHEDNIVSVEDDGRGMPFGKDGDAAIRAATVLHTSGKYDSSSYKKSGGQNGVGLKATNAVSEWLDLQAIRDKQTAGNEDLVYNIHFVQDHADKRKVETRKRKKDEKSGTKVTFKPDSTIFDTTEQDFKAVARRMRNQAYLAAGVRYILIDERKDENGELLNEQVEFLYEDGINDQVLNYIEGDDPIGTKKPIHFGGTVEFDEKGKLIGELPQGKESLHTIDVRVSMIYTETIGDTLFSYANDIPTPDGGPHENGLFQSVRDVFIDYAKANKLNKGKDELTGDDTKDGLVAVLAVDIPTNDMPVLQFESQTKEKLGTRQAKDAVMLIVNTYLTKWLDSNKKATKEIIEKMNDSKDARKAAKEAREVSKATRKNTNKKETLLMSSKLVTASSRTPKEKELFIVEGDSAGGSAKGARDPKTQAILPLRGKPLNVNGKRLSAILKNEELSTLVNVIGAGVGPEFNIDDIQYDKIVIMADADDDGYHIQMLLIQAFWVLMPDMLRQGKIYVANPPLYRLDTYKGGKREKVYALNEDELEKLRKPRANWELTRMKGLGEMNPDELEETTMNKGTRQLSQLRIKDEKELKEVLSALLGNGKANTSLRKEWIADNVDFNITEADETLIDGLDKNQLVEIDDETMRLQEATNTLEKAGDRYARKTITDRALPDVRDGLIPVQRAIIYAMKEMGLTANAKHKKNAQSVGRVSGDYHPHGTSSIYGAQVNLSQWFKNNVTLVEFQGNNGSIDGDGAAAERYTESRLTRMGEEMMATVKQDTVDMTPNYSNTTMQPVVAPAEWPVLFTNGHLGIAYGYACNFALHNPYELLEAAIYVNKNENARLSTIRKYVKGPDFPTGGIVYGQDGINDMYETGKGSFKIRAKVDFDGDDIVVHEIPYGETLTSVKDSIARVLVDNDLEKNIKGNSLIDSSKNRHIEIRIPLQKKANKEAILGVLFEKSKLEINFSANHNAIMNGTPQLIPLMTYLQEFVKFRRETVRRELSYELNQKELRLEIVEGDLKLIDIADKVIKMIRNEEKGRSQVIENLQTKKFGFTERQATHIADKQLHRISRQDFDKLSAEEKALNTRIDEIKVLLSDEDKFINEVGKRLRKTRDEFKQLQERKSKLIEDDNVREFEVDQTDLIEEKDVHVVVKPTTIQRMTETVYENNKAKYKGDVVHVTEDAKTTQGYVGLTREGLAIQFMVEELEHISIVQDPTDMHKTYNNFLLSDRFVGGGAFDLDRIDKDYIVSVTKLGQVKVMHVNQALLTFENAGYKKRGRTYNGLKLKDDEVIFARVYDSLDGKSITLKRHSGGREVKVELDKQSVQTTTASGTNRLKITKDGDFATIVDFDK